MTQSTITERPATKKRPAKKTHEPKGLVIPLADDEKPNSAEPTQVHVNWLDSDQRRTLKRMYNGLRADVARLKNGHHIDHYSDVIKWLLENAEQH